MVQKDTQQSKTTLERLLEVRMSVDFLEKKARNEQQKFMYTSSSQVLMAVREKMNELGLMLIPRRSAPQRWT